MNVSLTLEIRPGFVFNVMVTQDVIFPPAVPGSEPLMKLKRLRVRPSVKLAGRVSCELNETLTAHQDDYHHHVHGEAIDSWLLVVRMLESFVEGDRDFQALAPHAGSHPGRKGQGSSAAPVGGAAGVQTGTEAESRNG